MKKYSLLRYVIGVAVVWAVILCVTRFIGGGTYFGKFVLVCAGYAIGMLAMYIAVHIYKY